MDLWRSRSDWEHFPRVQNIIGIEGMFDRLHRRNLLWIQLQVDIRLLCEPDAVLPRHSAIKFQGRPEDLGDGLVRLLLHPRDLPVDHDVDMDIAVPGVAE